MLRIQITSTGLYASAEALSPGRWLAVTDDGDYCIVTRDQFTIIGRV